jgi:hypothetical protein
MMKNHNHPKHFAVAVVVEEEEATTARQPLVATAGQINPSIDL